MKTILNFIMAVFLMEVGFFLLFGSGLNMEDMSKNLNNYQNSNIPTYGTEVGLYIIDVGDVFLEKENLAGIMYETECYYLAQINDGRFIVIKTSKGSKVDAKVSEYARSCKDYYFFNKGAKPEILYLDGKIDKIPDLDEGDYKTTLGSGVNKFMPERRYVRMDVSDIVINVDYNVSGKSMDSVLEQSIKFIMSAANSLKKFLGIVVIFIGIVLIITFIRDILNGVTYVGSGKKVLVAGDDVFKNITVMKSSLQDNKDETDADITYDNSKVKETVIDKNLQNSEKEKKTDQKKNTSGKGFKLKSE